MWTSLLFTSLIWLFIGHSLGQCPANWTQYVQADKCVKAFDKQLTFFDAMQYCAAVSADNRGSMVSIHNTFQNAQLASLGQQASGWCPFWIGLYSFDASSKYSWIDDSDVNYVNWASGYPSQDTEDTAAYMNLDLRNRWQDTTELSEKNCFFCQQNFQATQTTKPIPTTTATTVPACADGWIYYNDACYFMGNSTNLRFPDAQARCAQMNSNLTSITSEEEETFVEGILPGYNEWIGLAKTDIWRWIDGSALTYTNWGPGQPEDNSPYGYIYAGGQWRSSSTAGIARVFCKQHISKRNTR